MAGRLTLDQLIAVQIRCPQPRKYAETPPQGGALIPGAVQIPTGGLRVAKTNNTKVGIHVAALTEARRLESRTRRKAIKAQQKRYATGAILGNFALRVD